MKLTGLILMACAYTTLGIRMFASSNNMECIVCNEFVPYLKDEISKNETQVAILDHLEELCGNNKECQFMIPMIINHCIDYVELHSSSYLCQPWC
jgi:hypothetical protein